MENYISTKKQSDIKVKEYIDELERKIEKLEIHLERHMNGEACKVTEIEIKIETLQEVVNSLKSRLEEK